MTDRRGGLIGPGIALGAGIGTAIGVAIDQVALWLPVGAVGVAIAAGIGSARKDES